MRSRARVWTSLAIASLAIASCKPDLGNADSLVTTPRVLAVRAEPAEAKPGDTVIFRVLAANAEGTIDPAPIVWSFCSAPKPITENNVVSTQCLGELPPFGGPGPVAAGVIPGDACASFGPDVPPGGFRPRDPDITGGYFQPVRALLGAAESFALARVSCNLANTSADLARAMAARYTPNKNPSLAPLEASADGATFVPLDSLGPVHAGAKVTLRARWAPEDAEAYVRLNPGTQEIEEHRESMRVSWFATAGTFESDRTGRSESDPESSTDDPWTAPGAQGAVHVWVVLRDSRGGVDFGAALVTVIP